MAGTDPAQTDKCSLTLRCVVRNFIRVDFPEPGLPVIQYISWVSPSSHDLKLGWDAVRSPGFCCWNIHSNVSAYACGIASCRSCKEENARLPSTNVERISEKRTGGEGAVVGDQFVCHSVLISWRRATSDLPKGPLPLVRSRIYVAVCIAVPSRRSSFASTSTSCRDACQIV